MRYDTRFPSAYCLHMHRMDAIKRGETEDRLLLLDAWRESELYTERERAALAWAEALTRISESRASDADYEKVRSTFSDDELLALSIGIATINAWNRLAIGFRLQHRRTACAPPPEAHTIGSSTTPIIFWVGSW
jgi:alkylhydroperoxidase family enzyme